MREKWKMYRPAAAAFLVMMSMSLTASTISFFQEPVCSYLQVGRGSFSAIFSLMTLSGALTNPFLGQFAGKKGVKPILILSGIWMLASMALFSWAGSLWMVYLAGFLMGAFGTNCVALCANVIVQQSYDAAKASGILGIVMAGSGVGGMIFNLLIPAVLEAGGWQKAMLAMGLCWLVLLVTAALVLGKEKPMETGKYSASVGLGMTRAEALRSPKLYLQILVIIVITAACGIQQQQPTMLGAYGFEVSSVSLLLSVQTAALAAGKVIQGLIYGKLGIRRGGCLILGVFALGCIAMVSRTTVYPGLLLLAFGFGIYTTLMPLVTRQLFGSREYASIWGLVATVGSIGTFIANPLWGTVYDLTGSYRIGLIGAAVLLASSVWVLNKLLRKIVV